MGSENRSRRVNRLIGGLADRQRGSVARRQLLAAGVTPTEVTRRIQGGLLIPVHRGVYLVGHRARAPYASEMAAVLALGASAWVSHRSAAAMLQLLPYPARGDVWITAARGDGRSRPGIRLHQTRLSASDVDRFNGVPVTTPARTLLDLAAVVGADQLERALANARRAGWVKERDLRRQLERCRGRRGAGRFRALLDREAEPAFTRSEMERLLLGLVRRHGLPEPKANARLHGYEVDFLWRERRVVVEMDGRAFHSDPLSFTRDRVRSNELQLRGYTVLRFTWSQVTHEPELVVARIRAALERAEQRT